MKTILLNFLILCVFCVNAQTDKKTTNTKEKFRIIKMLKFPNVDPLNTTITISEIQVLPMVRDSVRLGYSMKGMNDHIVTLKPYKPLTIFLQEHILKMYKKEFKKSGVKILWVIRELRLGEKEASTPFGYSRLYAYTGFNADAYISADGNLFKKVCSTDSVIVTQLGANITSGHGENIEKALKELLKRTLLNGEAALQQNSNEMTKAQIIDNSKHKLDIPILTDQIYKEGAYKNFSEFLNNNPSIINYEPVVDKKKKIIFVTAVKDTLEIWGICKKGEIYKYYGKTLIGIEKQGNGFIISDYVENATRRNENIFNASLTGVFVGGIIGPGISITARYLAGKPLLVNSYPYIDIPEQQPEATCIDMRTGEFSF